MLTVITPRSDLRLVSVDALKAEMEITDGTSDEFLSGMLDRISQVVEAHCRQVFSIETVAEDLRLRCGSEFLDLQRFPIVSVASISVDNELLAPADYEVDKMGGRIYRLSGNERTCWSTGRTLVTYTAGFEPMHGRIQEAVLRFAKQSYAARTRDPSLRSENILEGLYSYQLFDSSEHAKSGGLPADVTALLAPFINYKM